MEGIVIQFVEVVNVALRAGLVWRVGPGGLVPGRGGSDRATASRVVWWRSGAVGGRGRRGKAVRPGNGLRC